MKNKVALIVSIICFALLPINQNNPAAQEVFPTKPITILIGYQPGGIDDITVRSFIPAASKYLGQPIVVSYKPGAMGVIAADSLLSSKPDGYTLMEYQASTLAYGSLTHGASWGPKDFTVILGHSIFNYAMVIKSDAPWKNFDEWVRYVKQNPGFKYGTYGALSTMHVMMEWIAKRLDLKLVPIHFKGDGEGIPSLLGGHIQAYLAAGGHGPQIKAGKLRTLLQMTGEPVDSDPKSIARLKEVLPDAPMELVGLPRGIFGPKGIPDSIQAKLNEAFRKATVENPEFVQTHKLLNIWVEYYDPKELQVPLIKAHDNFRKLLKNLNLGKE